jgi:hypothetical protein
VLLSTIRIALDEHSSAVASITRPVRCPSPEFDSVSVDDLALAARRRAQALAAQQCWIFMRDPLFREPGWET